MMECWSIGMLGIKSGRYLILLIRQLNIQATFFPHVIPAKAGIQEIQCVMDSGSPPGSSPGCARNDGFLIVGLIIYFLIEEIDSTTMWDYIR